VLKTLFLFGGIADAGKKGQKNADFAPCTGRITGTNPADGE